MRPSSPRPPQSWCVICKPELTPCACGAREDPERLHEEGCPGEAPQLCKRCWGDVGWYAAGRAEGRQDRREGRYDPRQGEGGDPGSVGYGRAQDDVID